MKKLCSILISEESIDRNVSKSFLSILKSLSKIYGIGGFMVGTDSRKEILILEDLLKLRNEENNITVTAVIGSEDSAESWSEEGRNQYFTLIENCDFELMMQKTHKDLIGFYKNLVMIDLCDMVFMIGTDSNIEYWIKKREKPMVHLNLETGKLLPNLRPLD